MNIDTREVISYINGQKAIFIALKAVMPSDFNDGIMQGFNLVKMFIEGYEGKEGTNIADDYMKRLKENQQLHNKGGENDGNS